MFSNFPDVAMCLVLIKKMVLKFKKSKNIKPDKIELENIFIPPGTQSQVFNGFVTSQSNAYGLAIKIHHEKNGGVGCKWQPSSNYEGYPKILHGGISFAILDELLAYAIFKKFQTYSVTLNSKVTWLGKVNINSEISAKAQIKKRFWRFVRVQGEIHNHRGRKVVDMNSLFYIPSKAEFKGLVNISMLPKEILPFCGSDQIKESDYE
ncbi:PaaI family thioesterase [Marinicellulosiphila megalodicopiae]|uniref:PaaI family thioesterase n=1 Tax=Marinicellulosiphila megalodicopiae TaxID=2724896 RepID=UPI003BB064B7